MKKWEIGIMSATYPYDIKWQNDFVSAENKSQALDLAGQKGYYRNLRVRLDT